MRQGESIGTIGSSGNSTGCHVHFEIRGARNPF
ncbi:MAG: M23 family metallopeptidase [bacterium]|nr:M23 family metallopeptidase [bacterium]